MITIIHHRGRQVRRVYDGAGNAVTCVNRSAIPAFFELAQRCPDGQIVWCEARFEEKLDKIDWDAVLTDPMILASYPCSGRLFLPAEIGLVESSVFVKVKNNVKYPTWLMSGDMGGMAASTLLAFQNLEKMNGNLDYFLSSIAKIGMPLGLLCYSDPRLFGGSKAYPPFRYAKKQEVLYDFVNDHFKKQWLFLLLLQQFIYQKKLPLLFLLKAFKRSIKTDLKINLDHNKTINNNSNKNNNRNNNNNNKTIDVLIPTIGRKEQLHQVLRDLRAQDAPPERVIIVEQNPGAGSVSELDFITAETWPFTIVHKFIHRAGACNARNLALEQVEADWVFFADDDIRIPADFLAEAKKFIRQDFAEAFTVSCLQEGEKETIADLIQWPTFGTSCSFVKAEHLKNLRFDLAFEGGFGEDADFGMQLRNKGVDVLYNPLLQLKHLKAPIGGFRKKFEFPWENEEIEPKPSPTVMAYHLKHGAPFQLLGYKTTLFLKFYRSQKIKNPFTYLRMMQKRWAVSKKWALRLLGK